MEKEKDFWDVTKEEKGTLFGEATQTAIKNLHEKKPVLYPQR